MCKDEKPVPTATQWSVGKSLQGHSSFPKLATTICARTRSLSRPQRSGASGSPCRVTLLFQNSQQLFVQGREASSDRNAVERREVLAGSLFFQRLRRRRRKSVLSSECCKDKKPVPTATQWSVGKSLQGHIFFPSGPRPFEILEFVTESQIQTNSGPTELLFTPQQKTITFFEQLVEIRGFEPLTSYMRSKRSNSERADPSGPSPFENSRICN